MMMITIPYEDFTQLKSDAQDKANVVSLLKATFPDDTCQLIAIKSVLNVKEETEEEVDTNEEENTEGTPTDPGDTTEPPEGQDP